VGAPARRSRPSARPHGDDRLRHRGHRSRAGNHYFDELTERRFRIWVPAALPELLAMVAVVPGVAAASASEREALLAEVEGLYETSARAPEPLLLPYTLACWRAVVDHSELTAPVEVAEEGLRISL
jgi:hypothetical protein